MAPLAGSRGVRFTPPDLAQRLARQLVARGSPDHSHRARGDGRAPSGPARFLDPACGEGELLIALWRAAGRPREMARSGLFGIEIDPGLARRTRARIQAAVAERWGAEAGREAAAHITTADALDPSHPWPPATDIAANPPWVSLAGRQAADLAPEKRELYRGAWPATAAWPSLHGAFLERIAHHLHAGSASPSGPRRAALLLPASVAHLDGYRELRRLVTARTRLSGLPEELGEDAFPGVVEPSLLLQLEGRARARRGTSAIWWRSWTREERAFLERMASFQPLPPTCFADPGVHTGNARAELIVHDPPPALAGVREGRDLTPFHLAPARLGLRTDLCRTPDRRFRIAALERYTAVPILVRQTADRPIAALHSDPTYFRNSLLACTPPAELAPLFVVAVLNSRVAAAWHRLHFADARQRSFPQVKVAHLRSLPFPRQASLDPRPPRCGTMRPEDGQALARAVEGAYGFGPEELRELSSPG